jgi:Ni2+-binding GTPase involved in maturation of urease and hydrogenase
VNITGAVSAGTTNLIEVDIHALQLEIRGSVIPEREVSSVSGGDVPRYRMIYSHSRSIETVLAGDVCLYSC